jgi:tetratricopeptide (TPR) repeat protein
MFRNKLIYLILFTIFISQFLYATDTVFDTANLAFENKEYEKAEYYFTQASKESTNTDIKQNSYDKLFKIASTKKNYKLALFYKLKFMKIKKSQKSVSDILELSWIYDKLKDDKKSLNILKKLLEKNPSNEFLNLYLSLKYYELSNFEKTIFYIDKASELSLPEKKIFYVNLKNKICSVQNFSSSTKTLIQTKTNALKNEPEIARKNLTNYLELLKTTDFSAKLKLKFSVDNFKNTVLLNLFYSNFQDGKLDVYLKNNFCVGNFYIRDKKIFADENKELFFDISGKQDMLKEFFQIFDISQSELKLEQHSESGYIFNSANYKFLLDTKTNLQSIITDKVEIKFSKSINSLQLPTSIIFRDKKNYLKFQFLSYNFTNKEKQNLDEEVKNLNDSKCKS